MKRNKIIPATFVLIIILGFLAYFIYHKDEEVELVNNPSNILEDGRQCFSYIHEATETEPYAVSEFLDLTINEGTVSGSKSGTQSGPDMTNGYTGTLVGNVDDNEIDVVFAYTIEGSSNKEQEIYKVLDNQIGIEKLRYPLLEQDGILVPDTTKEFKILLYTRVECGD